MYLNGESTVKTPFEIPMIVFYSASDISKLVLATTTYSPTFQSTPFISEKVVSPILTVEFK